MEDKAKYIFGGMVGVFMICCLVLCIPEVIKLVKETEAHDEEMKKVKTSTVQLMSIDFSSEVEGTINGTYHGGTLPFMMGRGSVSGQIGEEQYFVAYQILSDGGKKLYKMKADISTIYDTLDADADAYAEVDKNGYGDILAYRIYVPTGSIVREYDLSLE